jgi:hypothetical protein
MTRVRHGFALFREFLGFARAHKAYWIVPLLVVLALLVALIVVGKSTAPFIYTLF